MAETSVHHTRKQHARAARTQHPTPLQTDRITLFTVTFTELLSVYIADTTTP